MTPATLPLAHVYQVSMISYYRRVDLWLFTLAPPGAAVGLDAVVSSN